MGWVVNVNVCSRSRVRILLHFIAWSGLSAVECCVHSLFSYYFVLDVIFFLAVIVLARPWSLVIGLFGVGSFHFVSPEVLSLRLRQETLGLLTHQLSVLVLGLAFYHVLFYRVHYLVRPWTWVDVFDFGVFAVGHSRLEYAVLAC